VFIHLYTKINGQPPAQTDMARYFQVEASSVHRMVVALEQKSLIRRQPRRPRSLQVLVPPEELPPLR
jgi:Mn-dependent DtxR family transcriptional regulator